MYQRVIISGRLGGDPVMKYLQDGTPVTSLNVATSERWNKNGEKMERTTWWRVSVFGKQAEPCNQYLSKGSAVLVEGTITVDSETGGPRVWTGTDGNPRASLELRASGVTFLSSKGEASESQADAMPF